MEVDIRLPNINAPTAEGQLSQIKSYLFQVVGQLQWAFSNLGEDFVVAEGNTDIWSYRKWQSGKAECWGRRKTSVDISTASGLIYYGTESEYSYPLGLFISDPLCQISAEVGSSDQAAWIAPSGKSTKTKTPPVHLYRPVETNVDVDIIYYAIGVWK